MISGVRRFLRPFVKALATGRAGPPSPRMARLTVAVPRSLGLLPIRRVDLVVVADLLLTAIMILGGYAHLGSVRLPTGELPPSDIVWLTAALSALPVALRDRSPLAAWRIAMLTMPFTTSLIDWLQPLPYTAANTIAYVLVLYAVAVRCDQDVTLGVWLVSLAVAVLVHPPSAAVAVLIISVTVLFGYNVRIRRNATQRLAREEERSQLAEAGQAVLGERARIARELHDVVAHHMSVIAIQAEAVPLQARGDPARLEAGLAEIRGLSLSAMKELRRVLGVLRADDGGRDTAPQPGLDRLEELVTNARAAGLAVLVQRSGALDGLPAAAGLSAYRIVQESLSNAMRHAPGCSVSIEVAADPAEVRLRVANGPGIGQKAAGEGDGRADVSRGGDGAADGHGVGDGAGDGGGDGATGHGLLGMRERAAVLGGSLSAGPTPGGWFVVEATLPITEER